MASLVIGVLGRKRHGKDTFASRLVDVHGFTRFAFADALKATMLDLDPVVRVEADEVGLVYGPGEAAGAAALSWHHYLRLSQIVGLVGWEKAKEVREVRRLLQAHGVAIRDHVSPHAWVQAVAEKVRETPGPVVITDVRFPNEADYVQRNGVTVRVVNPRLPAPAEDHVSEVALDGFAVDHHAYNVGNLDHLFRQADAIAHRELTRWRRWQ